MDLGIKGKRALVLGGSKGIGRAIATSLAMEGAEVALTGRDSAQIAETASTIRSSNGGRIVPFELDLSKPDSIDPFVEKVRSEFGTVDILVLNGGGPPPSQASDVDADFWRKQFDAMVLSGMRIAAQLLPAMRAQKWGRIIAISSTSIREPIQGLAASNALRSAVSGWAKTLAAEVASDQVTVNVLMPGRILTDRTRSFDRFDAESEGISIEEAAARSQSTIPVGRYGSPEEFADVATFIASARASYVTGVALAIDGGLTKSML